MACVFVFFSSSFAATLVHHWKMDEGTGRTVADSVGTAGMAIAGSAITWAEGKSGQALTFSGSNYALTTSENSVTNPDPTGGFAVAGWFRTSSSSRRMFLFEFEGYYEMRMNNGQLLLSFRGSAGNAPRWGEGLNDGTWHHFVAQNKNGQTELWIDGVLIGSRPETPLSLAGVSKNSSLGALLNGNNPFVGSLDDIRFYLGPLTASEIETLAGVAARPPVAVADAFAELMDTPLEVSPPGVLANDYDPDGDAFTAELATSPPVGQLTFMPNGSFQFVPPAGFHGALTFSYRSRGQDGTSPVATVTLNILNPATSLTPAEVAQIEADLGTTMSAQDKLDLASIVKPQNSVPWRTNAESRIETHRKSNLQVTVTDAQGFPLAGATVRAVLKRNRFHFGGVVSVMDRTDASGNLAAGGSTAQQWAKLVQALFNSVGLDNGLKAKITSQHTYLPGFFAWARGLDLPVRGHLLLWPGTGSLEDLDNPDAVAGVDFGDHLSNASLSEYKSSNVLGAVETYRRSLRSAADQSALAATVTAEISNWAGRWNVYEWDVVNEPLNNFLLQEILGTNAIASWFQTAAAARVDPNCRLLINDYQIISASFATGSTSYTNRRSGYYAVIDQLLAAGAPLQGVGFQSRFKFLDGYKPDTVYARLQDFATRYPQLPLVGTEFEIPDNHHYLTGELIQAYDEITRARITEEIMTTYFSHPNVRGLNAWDFMNPLPDGTDTAYSRALCYYGDGPGGEPGPRIKLNGLVWYYLHRIRYHSSLGGTTDQQGRVTLRGFRGDYEVVVEHGTRTYSFPAAMDGDTALPLALTDVTTLPSSRLIDRWDFGDVAGTSLAASTKTAGLTVFSATNQNLATDGSGVLRILRHPTATNTSGGDYLVSGPLTMGPRTQGKYEMKIGLRSATLAGGSPSGALVSFGLRDSTVAKDLFLLRLNKTTNGLVLSSYIDTTYRQIANWPGVFALTNPLAIRAEIDLDANSASVFLQEGSGLELLKESVPLSTNALTWDRMTLNAVNNQTQWGAGDQIEVDFLQTQRLGADHYSLWSQRINWHGYTNTTESADPDRDGLPNVLEFALGGDPATPDISNRGPQIFMTNQVPAVQFPLGIDSLDHGIFLEFSTNLVDWQTLPRLRIHGEAGKMFRTNLPSAGHDRMFSRVVVEP